MSIRLTIKSVFTLTDARKKRDVKIPAGTYEMKRIGNPLDPKNLPWLVLKGTRTGAAESFLRNCTEKLTIVETAPAPKAEAPAIGTWDDVSRAAVAAVAAPAPKAEVEAPFVEVPAVHRIEELPAPPVVDLTVAPLEPISGADLKRVEAFLGELTVLEALAAKVDPTVASKPDIAANLASLRSLRVTLSATAEASLRLVLERAVGMIQPQADRVAAYSTERDALEGEARDAADRKVRKAVSTLKGMRTRAANLATALRAFPAKRDEALASLSGTERIIRKTASWLRHRQADFLRKHPEAAPAPEQIVTVTAPAAPVEAPAVETETTLPAPTTDDDLRAWAKANFGSFGDDDLAVLRELRGY